MSLLSWVSWHPVIFCVWSLNTAGFYLCLSPPPPPRQGSSCLAVAGWEVLTCRQEELSCMECLSNPKGSSEELWEGSLMWTEPSQSIAWMCRFSVGSLSRFSIALKLRKTPHAFKRDFVHRACSANCGSAANLSQISESRSPPLIVASWLRSWLLPEVLSWCLLLFVCLFVLTTKLKLQKTK